MHLNVEIKARSSDHTFIRNYLRENNAEFRGTDYQTDTYFNVAEGRMKLRQGNIENSLIHYSRENVAGPKKSNVILYPVTEPSNLLQLLTHALGVKVTVSKQREIWFIGNVKFHLDHVDGLGNFIEIEAIDKEGNIGKVKLTEQCSFYMHAFRIVPSDLLQNSYSDMFLEKGNS